MRGPTARTAVVAKGGSGTGTARNFQHAKAHLLGRVRRRSLDAMPRPSGPGLPGPSGTVFDSRNGSSYAGPGGCNG